MGRFPWAERLVSAIYTHATAIVDKWSLCIYNLFIRIKISKDRALCWHSKKLHDLLGGAAQLHVCLLHPRVEVVQHLVLLLCRRGKHVCAISVLRGNRALLEFVEPGTFAVHPGLN